MGEESEFRVGIGHDTHRLGPGRPMILGGVTLPCEVGPIGHSDADVVLHALIDALLGALGRGDIGDWFPDTDPANKDRPSAELLAEVLDAVPEGARIVNVDAIVFVERPKLGPVKRTIETSLARLLGLSAERINVKAKTGESVGPIGRGEAVAAQVVVLLRIGNREKGRRGQPNA